jgi:hypothetical protein
MTTDGRYVVDGRGVVDLGLAELLGLPPGELLPRLLADEHHGGLSVDQAIPSERDRPVAAMPRVAPGTRRERRGLDVYNIVDVSPSNAWNDPHDARFYDFAFVARTWASRVIPNDRFFQVLFDSQAVIYPPVVPADVPEDGWRHRPTPTVGGTCFLPPAQSVAASVAQFPDRAALGIMYTDGMPSDVNDIAAANSVLERAGVTTVLIPYGFEFPWIAPTWEHTAFRIAKHVNDRRRAIAQTVALAIVEATGMQRDDLPKPWSRLARVLGERAAA